MWKLSRGRVLLDEPPEEEDGLRGGQPTSAAAPAPVRARLGAQVRAAGCMGERCRCMGAARRVQSWKGLDSSRGYEVTGPAGLLGLVTRSLQVLGPRASMCRLPRGAQPGYFPYWPAALPFAQLPESSRVPPGTPGTRGDRFQARCFYSGVGETEALNHGSPGRRFAHRKKLLVTVANAKCAKYLFARHVFPFF